MRLKLYRAARLSDAMASIRAELGADALILATRRVAEGVEVTAALEPEDEAPPAPLPPPPPPADPARQSALAWHAVPAPLAARLAAGPLEPLLQEAFAFAALDLAPDARPLLLAGPPGAGKTLTVARLATRLVMAGSAPLVVTVDDKRAGAVEQLAAFTRLLGLDLMVASNPVILGRALARRTSAPVLIDAPGSDPFRLDQAEELQALVAVGDAVTALVLPAGLDAAEAGELAEAYAALGATMLIATRFDLARRVGAVLAAAEAGRLAMAEAGIGPGAADGLAPLTPAFLAERLSRPQTPGARPCHAPTR